MLVFPPAIFSADQFQVPARGEPRPEVLGNALTFAGPRATVDSRPRRTTVYSKRIGALEVDALAHGQHSSC